jgi:hypothetical protein
MPAVLLDLLHQLALSGQNSKYLERPSNRSDRPGKIQENQWPRNLVLTFWQSKRIYSDNALTMPAPLLADRMRRTILQVEMKVVPVRVVGFWAEDCGENRAGSLMHPPQEFGFRRVRFFLGLWAFCYRLGASGSQVVCLYRN